MTEPSSLLQRLLRVPLFYKILLGNSLIVTMGAVAGTVVTVWHTRRFPNDMQFWLIAIFAAVGLIISFLVNNWIRRGAEAAGSAARGRGRCRRRPSRRPRAQRRPQR
ncbi:MAG: hypothetical protein R2856_13615 [Caldilineaceae bacterium]